jgi:peptidoglycan/xylan/chitin deacetylase (PgdA/CDA1 family)
VDPKPWFRCAFGSGADDARVLAAVAAAGYRHVPWDVEVEDWEPGMSRDALVSRLVGDVVGRRDAGENESIVLLHTWPRVTADSIGQIVARLGVARAELVRVDELQRFAVPDPTPSG